MFDIKEECADEIVNYFMQECGARISKKDFDKMVRILTAFGQDYSDAKSK